MVIPWVARAHLAVPVEREADFVKLLAVVVDVGLGGHGRVLAGLYGVLLGRQSVGVVAHGVQYVEALLALVARVYVGGYVAERVAYVQARPGGVREHVEHVELLFPRVLGYVVGLLVGPPLLPSFLNLVEVVFHCFVSCFCLYAIIQDAKIIKR